MTAQLWLSADPTAASAARSWVRDELTARSRTELASAAVLGVSELVTNAVVHVRGSVVIRILDSPAVRIEVYDESPHTPQTRNKLSAGEATNPSTVGRGLQILDSVSQAWGVSSELAGKCVWFQPVADGALARTMSGPLVSTSDLANDPPASEALVEVQLLDVPVLLLLHYRTRFRDLRRELTLIALDARDNTHVADRLIDTALRLDKYRSYGEPSSRQVEDAVRQGLTRTDLTFQIPHSAIDGIRELRDRLLEAEEFCHRAELLALGAGPQELAVREWYLGEVIAQADGAAPVPWPGDFEVTDELQPAQP